MKVKRIKSSKLEKSTWVWPGYSNNNEGDTMKQDSYTSLPIYCLTLFFDKKNCSTVESNGNDFHPQARKTYKLSIVKLLVRRLMEIADKKIEIKLKLKSSLEAATLPLNKLTGLWIKLTYSEKVATEQQSSSVGAKPFIKFSSSLIWDPTRMPLCWSCTKW